MALTYTFTISIDEPLTPFTRQLWLQPNTGQVFIRIGSEWIAHLGVGAIETFTEGSSTLSLIRSNTEPASPVLGQIWYDLRTDISYMWLEEWVEELS